MLSTRAPVLLLAAVASLASAGLLASPAGAQTVIQPTNAQSKDTFVYSFLPTFNFNNPGSGFDTILASGRSNTGHDLRSLLQFDLTGVTLPAGGIATLNLFVADGAVVGFPVVNPSPVAPVVTDVFGVTSAWDASTVNWATQPTINPTLVDSETIDGINRLVTFDVTTLVQGWLADPATNFGVSVRQRDVVLNGGSVQAIYHSAANANRPFLYVGPVPEPSAAVAVLAVGSLLAVRRRRGQ
jgi:hypothetical protein